MQKQQSKTLFLTSHAANVISSVVKNIDLSKTNRKLAFITTPAEGESGDKWWLEEDRKSLENAGFETFEYTFTGKKASDIKKDLADADFIFVSGGNTFYCLKKAQESGAVPVIQDLVLNKGKIYIGSSAGSVIAGPDIYPAFNIDDALKVPDIKNYEGFGLTDVVALPHWGNERFKDRYMNERLDIAYNAKNKIILLADNQYLYVNDDWYQTVAI